MTSGEYYTSGLSDTSMAAVEDTTYYMYFYVSATTTFDRIAIRTHSNFNGTATVRLGIYDSTGLKPSTLVLDAGTVSCTAPNTVYTITISQSLSAGVYWLAMNSQTNATTTTFRACSSVAATFPYVQLNAGYNIVNSWTEASVTGAFSTANPASSINAPPMISLRKA
jgi:hypothetical protein